MRVVSENEFSEVLKHLSTKQVLALDTETTSLWWHKGGEIFSIIIADDKEEYYFNFNHRNKTDALKGITPLPKSLIKEFQALLSTSDTLWILANAKFDMHFLLNEGLQISGKIWDVLVMARLIDNSEIQYSLDACGKRIGIEKLDTVKEWIMKNRAWSWENIPGKKGRKKELFFWMVPLDVVAPYGCQDARMTYQLYTHQVSKLREWENKVPKYNKNIWGVVKNEMALTKVCFEMERIGLQLDVDYVKRALQHETERAEAAKNEFLKICGKELVDSNKALQEAIGDRVAAKKTDKGNASFSEEALRSSTDTTAQILLEYRDATKRATSYYGNFLYHSDNEGRIHCNIRQSATTTGRFSISDPALQTLNAEDDGDWKVRNSFVARSGYVFLAIDYAAFEFRAMLDTAQEVDLAKQIDEGLDPHQATADLVGITRKEAKTLNFGLLYGMGIAKLAGQLNISELEAKKIKNQYFSKLPKIQEFINDASFRAKRDGFVVNRFGRPYLFKDLKFTYKAPNCLIQGGTAEAIKFAMVEIDLYFRSNNLKSRLVLQVHDELIIELHKNELFAISIIEQIMRDSWPSRIHKMEVSSEIGYRWGELEEYTEGKHV